MRYWRIATGYRICSSDTTVQKRNSLMDAALKHVSMAPMILVAWSALASPVFARNVPEKKTDMRSGVLGNRHVNKGEMSQADLSAVVDYYMLDDSRQRKHNNIKSVKASDLKIEILRPASPENMEQAQERSRHRKCDGEVVKVEFKSFVAILVVCAVSMTYGQWRRSAAKEAAFGLDTELHDFIPIRDTSTETEEEKEYIRMEAIRRIQRAKQKEEEYRSRNLPVQDGSILQGRKVEEEPEVVEEEPEKERKGQNIMRIEHESVVSSLSLSSNGSNSGWQDEEEEEENEQGDDKNEHKESHAETSSTKSSTTHNPMLVGLALLSVIVDDIKKTSSNLPRDMLPDGRALGCSRDGRAGRSMSVQTSRIRTVPSHHTGKKLDSKGILLVPFAPLAKSIQGKKALPLLSDKYNPMSDLHHFVSNRTGAKPQSSTTERDPFHALIQSLKSFNGFKVPGNLKKYDPVSHLDQLTIAKDDNDMISSFVRAIVSYQGPQASDFLSKYDPLQGMEDVMPEKGTSEYNILQGMLNAMPHGASDYSVVKALLHARPDTSHYDVWKALVEIKPPDIDGEVFKTASSLVEYVKKPLNIDFSKYDCISDLTRTTQIKKNKTEAP